MTKEYKIRYKKRKRYLTILAIVVIINLLNYIYASKGPTYLTVHPLQSAWNMNMIYLGNFSLSGLIFSFLAFFVAALPMADTIVEDRKSGYLNQVLLRKSKKEYLKDVYISNFIYGGLAIFTTYFINLIMWLILRPMFPMNHISSGFSNFDLFVNLLLISPILFYTLQLLVRFVAGGLIASLALFLNTKFKNSYIGLLGVFLIELIVNLLVYIYTIISNNSIVIHSLMGFFENTLFVNPVLSCLYFFIVFIIPIIYFYKISKREVIV